MKKTEKKLIELNSADLACIKTALGICYNYAESEERAMLRAGNIDDAHSACSVLNECSRLLNVLDSCEVSSGKCSPKIGRIIQGRIVLSRSIGTGSLAGKDFEMLVGAITSQPLIKFNELYYALGWEDIVELADKAGLFGQKKGGVK